jgi:hypothetical protein
LRDSLKNRVAILDPKNIPKLFCNVEQLMRYIAVTSRYVTVTSVNEEISTEMDIILEKGFEKERASEVLKLISQIFKKMVKKIKIVGNALLENKSQVLWGILY